MRVLVTGGYGYIGGHLVSALLEQGWEVVVLDTMFNSRPWQFGKSVVSSKASVCNLDAVNRALDRVSLVYHLAARKDCARNMRHPIKIFHTNVTGTVTLLAAAHEAGVDNVVHVSTSAVYGNVLGAEESGPKSPVSLYACSKLAAEQACQHYQNIGMNIKVLRLFSVWGRAYSSSIVDMFVHGHNKILGDGTCTRDFVFIGDVLGALLRAPNWDPSVYNIGTGVETTIGGLFDVIGSGEPEFDYVPECGGGVYKSFADMEYTCRSTGWEPKVLLHELSKHEVRQLCQ